MVAVWTPLGLRQEETPEERFRRDMQKQAFIEASAAQRNRDELAFKRETTTPWQQGMDFDRQKFQQELAERQRTMAGWQDKFNQEKYFKPGWQDAAFLEERLKGTFADQTAADIAKQEAALGAQERIAGINMAPNMKYANISEKKYDRQLAEEDRQREFMDMIMNSETAPRFMQTLTPEQQNAIVLMTAGKRGGFDPSSFVQSMLEKNANIKAQRAQAASLLQNAGLTNMAMDYMDPENPMAQVSRQIGAQVASGEPTEIPSIGPLATQLESEFKAMYDKDTSDFGNDPDETDQQNFLRKWDRAMQQIANSVPPEAAGKVAQRMLERITQIMQKGEDSITRIPGISWARTDVSQSLIEKMRRSPLYNQLTGGN